MDASTTSIERPEVIRLTGLSKRFTLRKDRSLKERLTGFGRSRRRMREDFQALQDINLSVRAGETLGLIGHNGSGKSTLLKMIGGILDPTAGTAETRGRIAALIELGAGFHPDLTGRENVYLNAALLGLTREETSERFDDIVAFADIGEFIDAQVKFYSSGMFVRLAFAVAVHTEPDLLLVDEVLAVGDEAFQRKCLDRIRSLQQAGVTIILVSHSLAQIQDLCDRAVLLDHGRIVADAAPVTAVARFRDLLARDESNVASGDHIVSVQTRFGGAPAGPVLYMGDDIEIDVLVNHEAIDAWDCGVWIMDGSGRFALQTSILRLRGTPEPLAGQALCRFRFPAPQLGDGQYWINAAFMDETRRHLAEQLNIQSFRVEPKPYVGGFLHNQPTVEIARAI